MSLTLLDEECFAGGISSGLVDGVGTHLGFPLVGGVVSSNSMSATSARDLLEEGVIWESPSKSLLLAGILKLLIGVI